MRVADLTDLGLRPLSVDGPGSDRVLRWVYTTDLPDPRAFIYGGELVLTSEGWYDGSVESCRRFVGALIDRAAAALVVGDILHGSVPEPIRELAEAGGLPLLFAPAEISYNALSQEVTERISADRQAEATATAGEYRQLITALVTGEGSAELLTAMTRQCGREAIVLSGVGRVVARSSDEYQLSSAELATVMRGTLTAVRLPVVIHLDRRTVTVYPIGRRTSYAGQLVVDGDIAGFKARQRRVIDETTDLLTLSLLADTERFWQRHASARELTQVLADADIAEPALREQFRQFGCDARRPTVVVSLTTTDPPRSGSGAIDLVLTVPDDPQECVVLTTQEPDQSMLVFVPWDLGADAFAEALAGKAQLVAPALHGATIRVGVGAVEDSIRGAVRAAQEARHLAGAQATQFAVATARDIDTYVGLLAQVPPRRRTAFHRRVLGDILAHPTGDEQLRTLEVFLRQNGSWQRAAEELHVHVSTLHYRIERIESLLGRDLATLPDRVDCLLALHLLRQENGA